MTVEITKFNIQLHRGHVLFGWRLQKKWTSTVAKKRSLMLPAAAAMTCFWWNMTPASSLLHLVSLIASRNLLIWSAGVRARESVFQIFNHNNFFNIFPIEFYTSNFFGVSGDDRFQAIDCCLVLRSKGYGARLCAWLGRSHFQLSICLSASINIRSTPKCGALFHMHNFIGNFLNVLDNTLMVIIGSAKKIVVQQHQ